MKSARLTVFELLMKMEANAYSNLALDQVLSQGNLSPQDKKFASSLFYGVIERKITLDYIIDTYSSKTTNKMNKEIVQILRLGVYQLKYMSSIPESAAVNESVTLTKQIRMTSASGFVNAILRNFIRNDKAFPLPKDRIKALSIEYSCPEWLIHKWISDYGTGRIDELLLNTISKPPVYVRVNSLKISENQLNESFLDTFETPIGKQIPHCLILKHQGRIEDNEAFQQGLFHVQDLSSQLCCLALTPKEGDILLDLCAAPGGKTYTLAQLMKNTGTIFAFDLHEKRVSMIQNGAQRLNITNIKALTGDAKKFNPELPMADKILCDVPCAGLGVIAKKPEIKYKNPVDLTTLPQTQAAILENAAKYLKVGGELIYSTCSLSREENDEVVDNFLSTHADFEGCSFLQELGEPFGDWKATVFPGHFNSDGFFMAKIVRRK